MRTPRATWKRYAKILELRIADFAINLGERAERLRPLHVAAVKMELAADMASSPDIVDAVMRRDYGTVRE